MSTNTELTTQDQEQPVSTVQLIAAHGQVTATSLQVAQHFGKRHDNVLRAIRNLDCSEKFNALNFEDVEYIDEKGERRQHYRITRDGFAFLAMGFTGKEAARWKEAYITAFNAMEEKLRQVYVEPLIADKEFRQSIGLKTKFVLQDQSRKVMRLLQDEPSVAGKRNLYWQLFQVNNALGIPTEPMAVLVGGEAQQLEGGAA